MWLFGCAGFKWDDKAVLEHAVSTIVGQKITITPDIYLFTPTMNSTVGIGLSAVPPEDTGEKLSFHWSTDLGYFVTWEAPDWQVVNLGKEPEHPGQRLYWSYPPGGILGRQVTITLKVKDQNNQNTLYDGTLIIYVDAEGVARVIRP